MNNIHLTCGVSINMDNAALQKFVGTVNRTNKSAFISMRSGSKLSADVNKFLRFKSCLLMLQEKISNENTHTIFWPKL